MTTHYAEHTPPIEPGLGCPPEPHTTDVCFSRPEFIVRDSGARQVFDSGMVRDTTDGKVEWHRVADGPMLARWAAHMTRGAAKYPDVGPNVANWMLAAGDAEYARFRASAFRHFMQWWYGETDEDHAAAVFFNINGAEYVRVRR